MATIDAIRKVNEFLAKDPDIQEVSNKRDEVEAINIFVKSPAGKGVVDSIRKDTCSVITKLIQSCKKSEVETIIPLCAQLEANLSILNRFTNTDKREQQISDLLASLIEQKNRKE